MKRVLLITLSLTFSLPVLSQIKNSDFELGRDTVVTMPHAWGAKAANGYMISLDNETKHAGKRSFSIRSAARLDKGAFQPFSQVVDLKVDHIKKIVISGFIKTKEVIGSSQLWCQVWDQNKMIDFQNSQMRGTQLSGTNDWKQLKLTFTVDTNVKKIIVGGLLLGSGSVWFDTFGLEDLSVTGAPPSKEVAEYIENFKNIVKQNSIYTDSLNWVNIDRGIKELSKGVATLEDVKPVTDIIMSALKKAGDKHSFIQNKLAAQNYSSGNVVHAQPYSKLLSEDVGYLYIPAFGSKNDTAMLNFASKIQTLISGLDTEHKIKGWIVDLRSNGGGNMYPMIAGLGPLTGESELGYFVSSKIEANKSNAWFYKDGGSGIGGARTVSVKNPYYIKKPKAKIAVLVGPRTASSGEMTAISFIGKRNVKLFGQPTAGYTTANQGFRLPDGAFLYLATSYVADRTKKKYLVNVKPDVLVNGDADAVVNSAILWVKE